jgi:hypothetical protein
MIVIFAYALTALVGFGIAFLFSFLVHIWFPNLAILTFVFLSLLWLRLGWRHATMRDRGKP